MDESPPVLDRRRLDLLRPAGSDLAQGDSFALLVRAFLESSRSTLGELRRAAREADAPGVAALAHRLKGASALFGALRLRAACAEVQAAALDRGAVGRLGSSIDELAEEIEAARAALEQELGGA